MSKKQENRHLDLSDKFLEMGHALMKEGYNKDLTITQTGSFFILLSTLVTNEEDMNLFSSICSMFSAKKILENLDKENNNYTKFLNAKNENETFEEFIKRLKLLRNRDEEDDKLE